jgi:phenylacetate-coenzyme A ligase PaaK-like adenylate-forming protein
MASFEELRARHTGDAMARIGDAVGRLEWSAVETAAERQRALRRLLAVAIERSPWHRRRLAHVDPARFTEADLADIPPMTKDDLMSSFDEIVTDPRLTLAAAEAHLDALDQGDAYLLEEFRVVASGGSSGRRGVFVYDWDGWIGCFLGLARLRVRRMTRVPPSSDRAPVTATVLAQHPSHMTSAVGRTFLQGIGETHALPVTLPFADIVAGLNRAQPTELVGYASALGVLAHEVRSGRLRIAPHTVTATSEPLLPEVRQAVAEVWNPIIVNVWGTSEGCITGMGCGEGEGMHLTEDMLVVEPVDAEGCPVPPGVRSSKIYLTNLFNMALPLIRYEITDQVTRLAEPCPCGLAFGRVADIEGRTDDVFEWPGGPVVHPHVFRSTLGREAGVLEYQVRQTPDGAEIDVCCGGPIDERALGGRIEDELRHLGLGEPRVDVRRVERIGRTGAGKLKRFVPLTR